MTFVLGFSCSSSLNGAITIGGDARTCRVFSRRHCRTSRSSLTDRIGSTTASSSRGAEGSAAQGSGWRRTSGRLGESSGQGSQVGGEGRRAGAVGAQRRRRERDALDHRAAAWRSGGRRPEITHADPDPTRRSPTTAGTPWRPPAAAPWDPRRGLPRRELPHAG